jgi:hypothetical protein
MKNLRCFVLNWTGLCDLVLSGSICVGVLADHTGFEKKNFRVQTQETPLTPPPPSLKLFFPEFFFKFSDRCPIFFGLFDFQGLVCVFGI